MPTKTKLSQRNKKAAKSRSRRKAAVKRKAPHRDAQSRTAGRPVPHHGSGPDDIGAPISNAGVPGAETGRPASDPVMPRDPVTGAASRETPAEDPPMAPAQIENVEPSISRPWKAQPKPRCPQCNDTGVIEVAQGSGSEPGYTLCPCRHMTDKELEATLKRERYTPVDEMRRLEELRKQNAPLAGEVNYAGAIDSPQHALRDELREKAWQKGEALVERAIGAGVAAGEDLAKAAGIDTPKIDGKLTATDIKWMIGGLLFVGAIALMIWW